MEKIGILTYHRAYSYGAKLQAYALATYLTSIGFEAEVIDYGNIGEEKLRKIGTKSLKDFIVTTLCYIASSIAEPQRIRHFDEFMDIIPHSPKHYDKANIAEANDKYDYFITGSDQVWNPKYNEGDLTYLLDFVKDNKRYFHTPQVSVCHNFPMIYSKFTNLCSRGLTKFLSAKLLGKLCCIHN